MSRRARPGRTRALALPALLLAVSTTFTACSSGDDGTSSSAAASSSTTSPGASSAGATTQAPADTSAVLLDADDLARIRADPHRFHSLVARCDAELDHAPKPVASLDLDPKYGANGENADRKTNTLKPDAEMAYRAGLCHLVTGDAKYAAHAQQIVDAWAHTLTTIPNRYGQEELIFRMPYLVAGASWARTDGWDTAPFADFLRRVVYPANEMDNPNNHGLWSTLTTAESAVFTGDHDQLAAARDRWAQILAGEVQPDGTMPREMERSDSSDFRGGPHEGIRGLAYTHFTLLAASLGAQTLAATGTPVWDTPAGAQLFSAFDRAAGWTLDPSTFPFYGPDDGKLQDTDAASYFPLLLRHHPNDDAAQVVRRGGITGDGFDLQALFGQ